MVTTDSEGKQRLEIFFRLAPIVSDYPIGTLTDVLLMMLADIGVQTGSSRAEFLTAMNKELAYYFTEIMENEDGDSTHH